MLYFVKDEFIDANTAGKSTAVPLQSPRSTIEQDKAVIQRARAMLGGQR